MEELKEQVHKEFNQKFVSLSDIIQKKGFTGLRDDLESFNDSLIDKTVQHEQERILQDLENAVKHTDNIEMKTFLYVDQIKSLITNKSDINK